ncbi:Splicing factor 3 subunit [Phytophthora cinnamomi]|uniref:Splicing factor 3 subunit n=1 Tax=Phytophthora cinnamomi TaxID=4785 RepID=UPI00355A48EF|nr:Splicing factor 3 subunit [Phytophthora cinnamomi]
MAAEPEEQHDATVQGRVTGIIYPPPDIRAVVDKTAQFVANNGRAFESRIVGERMSAKFSFLRDSDPYHAYYEHKVSEFIAKKSEPPPAPASEEPQQQAQQEQQQQAAPQQEKAQEAVKAAGDVVVEKKAVQDVTAHVAKKIKEKELEPPPEEKFIIKHPTLSALDQEIMYLTAQYTALSGSSFLSGLATREQRNPQFDFLKPTHPLFAYFTALVESYTLVLAKQDAQMKRIEEGMERMKVLDRCVHRMEWQRTEQERKDKEAAESDAERRALAQIDWHDFVVVETITFDDDDDLGASAAVEGEAKGSDDEDMDMEEDDDDEPKPDIKVVEDYVPQATAATAQQPLLSVDGKTLSSAEANEHMRILLMNPKWREETQRHLEKQKESSYAAGSAIADSLRRFATKRADIFASSAEEEARLLQATTAPTAAEQQQQQQQQQQEQREDDMEEDSDEEEKTTAPAEEPQSQQLPPGFSETGQLPTGPPMSQPPSGISAPMVSGPMMGGPPGMVLPPPTAMGAPGMIPPGIMGPGMGPAAPRMGAPGPPGMVPPHMQAQGAPPQGMSSGPPGIGAGPPGVVGPPGEDLEPAAKRQRTGGSSLLPEHEFASRHPGAVRLVVKVPNDPDNAQWKLEGQTLTMEVDVKDNMRTLKQKLMADLQNMPVNKQQLKFSMGFVKDSLTCAHYNFVNGTVLELSVRQRGGRR